MIALWVFFPVCCRKEEENSRYNRFTVDESIPLNDTVKRLSKYPELQLYNGERIESPARTAWIIQQASYSDGLFPALSFQFADYKCNARYSKDTMDILLNNYNGYFGNGVLVKVFKDRFFIRDIDPKTLKGETKFIRSVPAYQKIKLHQASFEKGDSIYGFIDYTTRIDSVITKNFKGYFKTIIK